MMTRIEDLDLADLARVVQARVPSGARTGPMRGRTAVRDAVVAHLGCSELQAEQIVDTMISRGFLELIGDRRSQPPTWVVRPSAP